MAFHRNTTISVILSAGSLALSACHFFIHPAFDLRLVASIASLAAFLAAGSEFRKYTSNYQLLGIFMAMFTLGISLDHYLPFIPFMTLAMVFSFLTHRKFFRKWFWETRMRWIDPAAVIASFLCYVSGNIYNDLGWKGWILPLLPLVFNAYLAVMDFMFLSMSLKNIKDKKRNVEIGKSAPEFSLPDKDGNMVHMTDFRDKQHLLVVFVRNDWCPSCRIKLRTYDQHRHKFNEKNIQLLTISSGEIDTALNTSLGIQLRVLYDQTLEVCKAYGVQLPGEAMGNKDAPGMPLPASFLIDKGGIVRYTSRPDRLGEFLDPTTIFPVLESLN